MRKTLGNRMSKKLKEYGISQRLLATLTHTTEVSVSRYVNDKRIPKADVLYRIACALHTTTDYLLGLTTSEQTNEEYYTETTVELAKLLAMVCNTLLIKVYEDGGYVPKEYDEEDSGFWLKLLREKHNE